MLEIWHQLLISPLLNSLVAFYSFTGNLGVAIILLTIVLRVLMTPLVLPSLRMSKKMQELAPEISLLKEKYKDDKQGLMLAQSQLYKSHGANPAAGCLPQIIQLVVLIALFNVFNSVLATSNGDIAEKLNPKLYSFNQISSSTHLSTQFLYLDLVKPDTFPISGLPFALPGVFLLLSAAVQFLNSKMVSPAVAAEKKVADKTPESTDDAMVQVQKQMLFLFPLMTIVIGYKFPSGLVLYWFVFSAVSIVQQYFVSGWGGLTPWLKRLNLLKPGAIK